jgi:hypothetical protein
MIVSLNLEFICAVPNLDPSNCVIRFFLGKVQITSILLCVPNKEVKRLCLMSFSHSKTRNDT